MLHFKLLWIAKKYPEICTKRNEAVALLSLQSSMQLPLRFTYEINVNDISDTVIDDSCALHTPRQNVRTTVGRK